MCGLFTVLSKTPGRLPEDVEQRTQRALRALSHRGPDGAAIWVDPERTVALGHVRLAVIDPRPESNQPFVSDCGRYWIVFNGEIYNYLELRGELQQLGYQFRTSSDTEVLLAALITWGTSCINRFNGMWAFVFVDMASKSAVLCRDRWGVKPLYVHDGPDAIILASEAKAIIAYLGVVPGPNLDSISRFLKYSVSGSCLNTWFLGISRFPPAHYQRISIDPSKISGVVARYWDYPPPGTEQLSESTGQDFLDLLTDAVRIRLRSDVPLGLSLSGGLDSSSIAWLMSERLGVRADAYCAWFEPIERSELSRATEVATRYGHKIHPIASTAPTNVWLDFNECIYHLDGGHASPAIVPYLNICRNARRNLTVMLEGQGADELLLGYSFLYPFAAIDYLARGDVRGALGMVLGQVASDGPVRTALQWLRVVSSWTYSNQYRRWSRPYLADPTLGARVDGDLICANWGRNNAAHVIRAAHRTILVDLLQYGDAISMSVGLETRCPFLDYRLVDFACHLPLKDIATHRTGKFLLRSLASGHLPDATVWPGRKDGFTNTTEQSIRRRVRDQGLPADAVEASIQFGLFRPEIRDAERVALLPDGPFIRVMSTLAWIQAFYIERRALA
jgi:asparagine synthase (glutamine-hydrolysing)